MTDFTDSELEAVQDALYRRYKEEIEIHLADCEVQPDLSDRDIVERPAIFWNALGCNFIVIKMDQSRFHGRYFYNPHEQFPEKHNEYSDVINCASSLLRDEADHARETHGVYSGSTGADLG